MVRIASKPQTHHKIRLLRVLRVVMKGSCKVRPEFAGAFFYEYNPLLSSPLLRHTVHQEVYVIACCRTFKK